MRTFFNLLKLQIDNKTDFLKTASPKRMILALLRGLLLVIALTAGSTRSFFASLFLV